MQAVRASKATAEAHLNAGAATRVQLDDENGKLVYSVEIGASDVKVDAATGEELQATDGELRNVVLPPRTGRALFVPADAGRAPRA